ncbi:hypothetical protein DFJ58DRAFT_735930 [Suillus subalutaceus]|uniref:uncharacterized protein n=1 Tax=Suillus subalutaceus TaxID=48586 RepID=UPI001B87D77E|nr:uncharacterized protein DFJ58DRAFT_735930 [Suillus subalutaceus]KAG1834019.1 hypothetical protein DFJ58DRAFT_735930 [Suillus subalutaceus]
MYRLNCFVLGDDPLHVFEIKIAPTESVSALQNAIKEQNKHEFDGVDAKALKLWKVDLPVDEMIEHSLSSLTLGTMKSLSPVTKLQKVFSEIPEDEHLHIVIEGPPAVSSKPLHLNCFVLGDDPLHVFEIKIAPTESVSALQNAIKEQNKHEFDGVDAKALKLWKVKINLNDPHLLNAIRDEGVELKPLTKLSEVFTDGVECGCIHVIVQHPAVARDRSMQGLTDYMAELNKEFKNALHLSYPPASVAAKSKEYCTIQGGPTKIYDGRYAREKPADTSAPPIQLFNPAFAYFSSKAFDPEYAVPDETLRDIQKLMTKFAAIHASEDDRQQNVTSLLEKVIQQPLLHVKSRRGKCIPDAVALYPHKNIPIHLMVVEEKNEFGDGGSDPSVQASFSFHADLRSKCNCPAFLVAHAGPWLAVLGAVFTEKYIVQRLTDFIWIPDRSALDDGQFLRIGRVLYALRESVVRLTDWYKNVLQCIERPYNASYPTVHPRFYPTPDTYLHDKIPVQFKYERSLERDASCVTYLAKTKEDNPINVVVKFVTRYGEDVHKAMAEAGFAPKLLYYGKIDVVEGMPSYGGLRMVVMEYVDGPTAYSSPQLPPSFHQELTNAIEYCHGKGFVFGDLRKPNVMITKDGKVQLIDFDWAGREGEVTYPVSISPAIDWPEGVQGLGPILKQHDHDMLVRYRN